jgi:site-specific DNA recombinase
MQGQWINSAPYYRCRFPAEYALANKVSYPRNVYLRQDAFDTAVNTWLATAFAPARLCNTIDQIMAGQLVHADTTAAQAAMARIEDASVKMARYRAALDAGGDPEEIGKWISEAKVQRRAAEAELCRARRTAALTRQQVQAVIEQCAYVANDLRGAESAAVPEGHRPRAQPSRAVGSACETLKAGWRDWTRRPSFTHAFCCERQRPRRWLVSHLTAGS